MLCLRARARAHRRSKRSPLPAAPPPLSEEESGASAPLRAWRERTTGLSPTLCSGACSGPKVLLSLRPNAFATIISLCGAAAAAAGRYTRSFVPHR